MDSFLGPSSLFFTTKGSYVAVVDAFNHSMRLVVKFSPLSITLHPQILISSVVTSIPIVSSDWLSFAFFPSSLYIYFYVLYSNTVISLADYTHKDTQIVRSNRNQVRLFLQSTHTHTIHNRFFDKPFFLAAFVCNQFFADSKFWMRLNRSRFLVTHMDSFVYVCVDWTSL